MLIFLPVHDPRSNEYTGDLRERSRRSPFALTCSGIWCARDAQLDSTELLRLETIFDVLLLLLQEDGLACPGREERSRVREEAYTWRKQSTTPTTGDSNSGLQDLYSEGFTTMFMTMRSLRFCERSENNLSLGHIKQYPEHLKDLF